MNIPAAKPAAATKNQNSRRPNSSRISPKIAERIFIRAKISRADKNKSSANVQDARCGGLPFVNYSVAASAFETRSKGWLNTGVKHLSNWVKVKASRD